MEIFTEVVSEIHYDLLSSNKMPFFTIPMRRRYRKFLPAQAFQLGDKEIFLAEGPTEIVFRKKWSFKTVRKQIRIRTLIPGADGCDPMIKLYFRR